MIPAWVTTLLVVFVACIGAIWVGSTLAGLYWVSAAELVVLLVICVICVASDNFPLLLAIGMWSPFAPPIPGFRNFPSIAVVAMWISVVLFLHLALKGTLPYRRSFNWALLLVFAWVPVRFLMNPIHKLGANAGGSGTSGAMPYFLYVVAAGLLVFLGAVLYDRARVIDFLRWCRVVASFIGIALLICAFIPATGPFLIAMGTFAAGDIGDGVQRLVVLPGYGLFLVQAALCPALFRMRWWSSAFWMGLGFIMIVVGGNRSAMAAAFIVIPTVLLLRRKTAALIVCLCVMLAGVGVLRVALSNVDEADIPWTVRSLGIVDSKIDKASGGDVSAEWRYEVWQSGIDKIMEAPLIGKGFGNLPEHLDTEGGVKPNDFEALLAGGLAHNGFVSAAYGFGIPFAACLSFAIVFLFVRESISAFTTDRHDVVLAELHAYLGGVLAAYPLLIYSSFDLNSSSLWIYAAVCFIMSSIPKAEIYPEAEVASSLRKYGTEAGYAGYYSPRKY